MLLQNYNKSLNNSNAELKHSDDNNVTKNLTLKNNVEEDNECLIKTPKSLKFNSDTPNKEKNEKIISPPSSIQSVETCRDIESSISVASCESSESSLKISKRLSLSSSLTPTTSTPDSKSTQTPNTSNYYYHQSSFHTPSISSVFPPSIRYLMNSNTPSPMKSFSNSPIVNIKPNLIKSSCDNEYNFVNTTYKLNENEFNDIVDKLDENDLMKMKCDLEKLIEENNHQLIDELIYSSELNDNIEELDRKSKEVSVKAQLKYKI